MSHKKEVNKVVKHILKNGGQTPKVVRKLWPDLDLTEKDIDFLAQEGFIGFVNAELRRGDSSEEARTPTVRVRLGIVDRESSPENYETAEPQVVRVTFLEKVSLEGADGVRKLLFHFNIHDCRAYISHGEEQAAGIKRKNKVMAHIESRLKKFGRKEVSELAAGERSIIEKMWRDVSEGVDSSEHERFSTADAAD